MIGGLTIGTWLVLALPALAIVVSAVTWLRARG